MYGNEPELQRKNVQMKKMLGIYADSFIEEYKHLTQMVYGYGAKS